MRGLSLNAWASLALTWYILMGIVGLLYLGACLAGYPFFEDGLSGMNAVVVFHWITAHASSHPLVLTWLAGLVLTAGALGINLAACLCQRFANTKKNGRGSRFWVFLGLHLIFGMVMTLHGLEMVTGEKHPWQQMREGESFRTDSGWGLNVHEIIFINDVNILNSDRGQRRMAMTAEKFNVRANLVRASLLFNGKVVTSGDIRIMEPLTHKNIRVVLNRFGYGPEGLSARLRIVDAPLHKLFFISYALLIITLLAWVILRFQRS